MDLLLLITADEIFYHGKDPFLFNSVYSWEIVFFTLSMSLLTQHKFCYCYFSAVNRCDDFGMWQTPHYRQPPWCLSQEFSLRCFWKGNRNNTQGRLIICRWNYVLSLVETIRARSEKLLFPTAFWKTRPHWTTNSPAPSFECNGESEAPPLPPHFQQRRPTC